MHGEQKHVQPYGGETRSKKDHLEDTGVDDRTILKWTLKEIGRDVVDWTDLVKILNKRLDLVH
jgi:hypothetical protein